MPSKRSLLPLLCLATTLFILLPAQSLFAQDNAQTLLKYGPDKAGAVFGVNLKEASSSTFYKEGLGLLKTVPEFNKMLTEVEGELNLNLEKDIHSVVAFTPRPTSSSKADDTVVIIMSGSFDKEKIKAKIKEEKLVSREIDKLTVYSSDDKSDFAILSNDTVIMTSGKKSFRDAAFKSAAKGQKAKGASKSVKSLTSKLNTSKHLWFAADTSKAASDTPGNPQHIAVTFDFSKGLNLSGSIRMKDEEEAKKALAQYEENKAQFEGSAAMIGAPSFAKNLKISAAKKELTFSSSMPDKEVSSVASFARGMMASQQR